MELKILQENIRKLISLEETSDPVISCYINLEKGISGYRNVLDERLAFFRKNLSGKSLLSFETAIERIEGYLKNEIIPETRGAAIFSRIGSEAFFLPMQFRVPLPNWFRVDSTPNIYHLVEWEEKESQELVDILQDEMYTNGLAVLGSKNCYNALKIGQADMLILAKKIQSEAAWKCTECSETYVQHNKPQHCQECGKEKFIKTDIKEDLVKLAEKSGCPVEVVNHSDFLMMQGGVGCLLRYHLMDELSKKRE